MLGENGTGKTIFIKLLAGVLKRLMFLVLKIDRIYAYLDLIDYDRDIYFKFKILVVRLKIS
jgi:translation initiation factor RLI1